MTTAEKLAYVDAVLALKATPITQADLPQAWAAGARNRYDVYVWIHMLVGLGAHRGPAFAPWHREFLRQFELELQQVSSNPKLTIPYWDWIEYKSLADNSADSNGVGAGFPFTDNFMGGMGTGADNRVETGKFSENEGLFSINVRTGQTTGLARDDTTYLRRLTGQNINDLPDTADLNLGLTRANYDAAPFQENNVTLQQVQASFRKSLEYLLHNGPHGWVGGNMMPLTSPNDPVFFLHHCNVDKIWAIWQQRDGRNNQPFENNYQPASGVAEHALTETMLMLEQDFFLFSVLNQPSQLLNHKALGFMYDTDLPEISLVTPTINFGDIPENTTTYLPVQFNIETCRKIKFRITAIGGNAAFEVPDITSPYEAIVLSNEGEPQTGEVYIKLNATTGLGNINGVATIEAFIEDTQGHYSNVAGDFSVGTWNVNFNAEIITRPQSAICLVLDKSGSMSLTDGTSLSRYDMLQNAVGAIRDILRPNDGIGMVYYDTNENPLFGITQMAGGGTNNVNAALANTALNPGGLTAIGKGIIEAADVLNTELNNSGSPYSNFGMLVLTDGNENVAPFVGDIVVNTAITGLENDIYAIGLGNQGGVSDDVLSSISRYILITGDMQGDERLFRLTNYFVQILADIKQNEIVLDPIGRLLVGMEHEIEFEISEADIDADIIVLSPFAPFINIRLVSPDGTVIQGSKGNIQHIINSSNQIYRVTFPAIPSLSNGKGTYFGKWKAVLKLLSREEIKKQWEFLNSFENQLGEMFKYRSIPYSLSVQSYSDLKFKVQIEQSSQTIGSILRVDASLNQYRLPISGTVQAEMRLPDGSIREITLLETIKGKFETKIEANQSGVYQFRVKAKGYSLNGIKFTREALRSVSIYKNKPDRPTQFRDEQEDSVCKLINCLLKQEGIIKFLDKNGLNPNDIKKCFDVVCKQGNNPVEVRFNPKISEISDAELKVIEKLKPLILTNLASDVIESKPELKKVKFTKSNIPKFDGKPMMMPAFKLNEKGEIVKLNFSKQVKGKKRKN